MLVGSVAEARRGGAPNKGGVAGEWWVVESSRVWNEVVEGMKDQQGINRIAEKS